jgi:urea transport system permease protein
VIRRLGAAPRARWLGGVVLGAALLLPVFSGDAYWFNVIATSMVFAILALSLDLLWGYSGILNLAPALSFGLGAYAWGIVGTRVEGIEGTYLAALAAVGLPALVAAVVAFVSFSAGARDIYFALITLALTLVLQQVAQSATDLTGGSNGLIGVPWPTVGIPGVFETTYDAPDSFYYVTVVATAAVFGFCVWLVSSRVGTVLEAIRESDQRAETLGYSTLRHRVMVSAVSAAIGGIGGMLYAPLTGIVDPSVFGVALSVQAFVWVAVGGQGTLVGPLIAALLISTGQQTLTGSSATAYLLGIGVAFILVVLFLPGGLASIGTRMRGVGGLRPRVPAGAAAPGPVHATAPEPARLPGDTRP